MKRRWIIRTSLAVAVWGAYLLSNHENALAQPNSASWQSMQSHQAAQQAMNHAIQQSWHNQQVMRTSRELQDFASRNGGGGGAQNFQQQAAAIPQVWQPGERFQSGNLELQYERLSNVDYQSLSPVERGQYKAACRKLRLAVRYGYVYR